MKIQNLAVIFIIIILPISLVLASYTKNRVDTINIQTRYDSKLNDATYDALKAYQLNSFNNGDTSDYTNSKMRDIKASANTFFNSMASGFSELGYTKENLQNYIPALVYTMYDGYYIYSPYINYWYSESGQSEISVSTQESGTYSNGQTLYGLKPYVYYSCRYKREGKFDVTITYSLDNYIQIQGCVFESGKKITISKYGYLLDNVIDSGIITYKGTEITAESNLSEKVYIEGEGIRELSYIKKNGTKYYLDNGTVFSVIKGKKFHEKV